MAKASRSIEINRNPQECYEVITDYEKYPEFLDEVKEVQVLESSENKWTVKYTIHLIKKVDYILRHEGDRGKELGWSLVEGFFKSNTGAWVLEELEEGKKTKTTYNIDVELGRLVPSKIVTSLTEKQLPKMLETFKARIERLYPE